MLKRAFICYISLLVLFVSSRNGLQAQQQNRPVTVNVPVLIADPLPAAYPNGMKVSFVRTWETMTPIMDPGIVTTSSHQDVKQSTLYVDGLGRPLQTVNRQITPATKDLVTPVIYDNYGRSPYQYQPYASNDNSGLFKTDAFDKQKAFMQGLFNDEQVYYGKTEFEASPLNRVVKTLAAGNSWAGSGRGVSMAYQVNTAADGVRIWRIANNSLGYANKDVTTNIPYVSASYAAGELYKNVTTDEAGNTVVEYKDKEGQVVMKKVESGDNTTVLPPPSGLQNDLPLTGFQTGLHQAYNSITLNDGFVSDNNFTAQIAGAITIEAGYVGYLCTYYVYDDLNQLRFVIPPKAVMQLMANNWLLTEDITNELCFRYEYDARKRLIAKKVPGADWVYMIYDVRDRLVFTQDGNLRNNGQWMTTLYDGLNRPVLTGVINWNSGTPIELQQVVDVQTEGDGETAIEGITVTKNPIPSGSTFVSLSKTYYDRYDWTNKDYKADYNNVLDAGSNAHAVTMPAVKHEQTTGLVTGSQVRVIADPGNLAAGNWLTTVSFYDDRHRIIQINSETLKGTDILTNQYDFAGKVLCSYLDHTNSTGTPASLHVKTNMEYDHAGRLLEVWKALNDDAGKKTLIVKNEYDELGQLKNKELGHKKDDNGNYATAPYDPLEILNYTYNIRGWMTGINKAYANNTPNTPDAWFGMELNYDKGFEIPQYNGNIAGTKWRSKGDGEQRAFGYTYDKANRLLGADFTQLAGSAYPDNATINFDMVMGNGTDVATAYDENGNIMAMKQWGLKLKNSVVIDDLHYEYYSGGNKLRSVTDNSPAQTGASLGDFTDNNVSGNDYGYDVNGNMVADVNKKLNGTTGIDQAGGAITYNHLNLPCEIAVDDGNKGTITYIYDAAGVKLKKVVEDRSTTGKVVTITTSYVGRFVYESKATSPADQNDYADRLQFIGHEEGRIRYIPAEGPVAAKFEYDYFVKDHLGNVRMVLTEEQKHDIYPAATMESNPASGSDAVYEEKKYYNVNDAYIVDLNTTPVSGLPAYQNNNGVPNPNPNGDANANSAKLYKLHAATNKTGLGITMKVMAGDQLSILGKSYWFNSGGNYNEKFDVPVSSILEAFLGSPAMVGKGLTTTRITTTSLTDALNGFRTRPEDVNEPWSYINWIFFDEQFNYAGGGFDRVDGSGVLKPHMLVNRDDLKAPKNGYVFVYCSNESQVNVFFDNLQVILTRGPLLEETHYYPFGLTMAGISSKALNFGEPENKHKFNGIEQNNDFDLNMYDARYRNLDPQIGRFWQIDPKIESAEAWSPYSAMLDNPIRYADPLGDSSIVPWPARVSYNPFAPLLWYGNAAVKNDNVRINYSKEAATLQPGDKQARADLKEKYRTQTPEPFKTIVEKGRPMAGEQAKVNDPAFKGNAAKTNAEVTEAVKTTGTLGRAFLVAGAVQSTVTIATSKDPVREAVTEGAGWAGAIYVGGQGAAYGTEIAGPYGGAVLGFIGSAAGFFFGKNAGNYTVDAINEWKGGNDASSQWMRNPDGTKKDDYLIFK